VGDSEEPWPVNAAAGATSGGQVVYRASRRARACAAQLRNNVALVMWHRGCSLAYADTQTKEPQMYKTQAASELSIIAISSSQLAAVTGAGGPATKNDSGATVVDRNAPRGGGWKGAALKGGTIIAGVYGLLTHQELQPKTPEHPERIKPPITVEQPIIPTE
jgi:hypothetical protein